MIPQDDFASNQHPHWIPFLELKLPMPKEDQSTSWLLNNTKTVVIGGSIKSPSPTPPVSPRGPEKSKKSGIGSFIKYLKGRHHKKKDRDSLVLEYTENQMAGYSVCESDDFIYLVFGGEPAPTFFEDDLAYLSLWNELQKNSKFLPAIWKKDSDSDSVEGDAIDAPFKLSIDSPQRLPLLSRLLKLVGLRNWQSSFDDFALCVINLHRDYASEAECVDILEFLVGNDLYVACLKDEISWELTQNISLDKALVETFMRCWKTGEVFNFSATFWESPWWELVLVQEDIWTLFEELATSPVDWRLLSKPLLQGQLKALRNWVTTLSQNFFSGLDEVIQKCWVQKTIVLFQFAGDPLLGGALDNELQPGGGGFIMPLGPDGKEVNRDVLGNYYYVIALNGIKNDGISKKDLDFCKGAHSYFMNDMCGDSPYQMLLWRHYLHAALHRYKNDAQSAALAVSLAAELLTEKMEAQDVKLLCLCLPWLNPAHSQTLADALFHLLVKQDSGLMRTIWTTEGLRPLVAVQLASYLGKPESAAAIKTLLGSEGWMKGGGNGYAKKDFAGRLSKFLAYSSFVFYGPDTVQKCLPDDVRQEMTSWMNLLPACAFSSYSDAGVKSWLAWLKNLDAQRELIKNDAASYLALVHVCGQYLINGVKSNDYVDDGFAPTDLALAVIEVLSIEWLNNLLACEVLVCLLMPYASQIRSANKHPEVVLDKLQTLLEAVAERLPPLGEGITSVGSTNQLESNRRQLSSLLVEFPRCFDLSIDETNIETPVWKPKDGDGDIDLAYRNLARACLAVHFGANAAQVKLAHLRLQFSVLALQYRDGAGVALRSLYVARERTKLLAQ